MEELFGIPDDSEEDMEAALDFQSLKRVEKKSQIVKRAYMLNR